MWKYVLNKMIKQKEATFFIRIKKINHEENQI